ncbi:IS110 family transposase [Microbacterium deminutum]|uniref:IS110 family transposase n=1 Tax=Microbacterium deminutum TaxID=344164 RepID=A0ABN2R1F1_9MICO
MCTVADEYSYVVGVDTHARTHTLAIVEAATGRLIATDEFPTSPAGLARAVDWARRRAGGGALLASVEGTGSYGAGLVAALTAVSIPVVEAKPPRTAARSGRGKSDSIDAEAATQSVLGREVTRLLHPRAGKVRSALRVLLAARRSMDTQRTASRNTLTALLRVVDLGLDARKPLTDKQVSLIASWRARPSDDIEEATARGEAVRLARDVLVLTVRMKENRDALELRVTELAPTLLQNCGIGPVTAAVFVTVYSHPGRVRSEAAFASLGGVSPLEASSGNTKRHRLNRSGDRQLNRALDVVTRVRIAKDPQTRAYRDRRLAEGKTTRDIRRSLKRYIARQIYRELTTTMRSTPSVENLPRAS